MTPKYLSISVIAIACLLGADRTAFGQGGSGRSGVGGAYSHGGPGSGTYGFSTGSGGYYGGGLFYGDYLTGGGYPGYFAPFTYPHPGLSHTYADPYDARSISHFFPSTREIPNQNLIPIIARPAILHVVLPDPQATVHFDGHLTALKGRERIFYTPDLTVGSTYEYQLRAAWMQDRKQVTQERTIVAIPGQTTDITFTIAN